MDRQEWTTSPSCLASLLWLTRFGPPETRFGPTAQKIWTTGSEDLDRQLRRFGPPTLTCCFLFDRDSLSVNLDSLMKFTQNFSKPQQFWYSSHNGSQETARKDNNQLMHSWTVHLYRGPHWLPIFLQAGKTSGQEPTCPVTLPRKRRKRFGRQLSHGYTNIS